MRSNDLSAADRKHLDEVLGYLNFSSGSPDPCFRDRLNRLFQRIEASEDAKAEPWITLKDLLLARLAELAVDDAPERRAFANTAQALAVVEAVFGRLPAAYRRFHRDLLAHQDERTLFRPFFFAKGCEAALASGGPWEQIDRIVRDTVRRLNDFLGYRPVAVLRTRQKIEPYAHEWVCPVPLYLAQAGIDHGVYHDLLAQTLEILRTTDAEILRQAQFDPKLLDELAVDPRAYDFDHPANKRPNYHFGQWDPQQIDTRGHYRRFVLQGVTLDAIWQRTQAAVPIPANERLFEAAALLAGTMLMASAISGNGPDAHDSSVTLARLLPRVAALRDAFYTQLLKRVEGSHGQRLRDEAERLRQPFGGARQQLNQTLARMRASQLEHVHLAQLFARMGYADAGARQISAVPVASARVLCQISSRLTIGHQLADRGQAAQAVERAREIEDLLHRGIECGALVDPWNILGFQGQFSLFPAIENTVRDHRVDVLLHVMRQTFDLLVRLVGEAAAAGDREAELAALEHLRNLAAWWDEFASVEIEGVDHVSGREALDAAEKVAAALGAWRKAGEAAGDVAFWRNHVETFQTAETYALVIETLLKKRDFVASRALLMQWLSQAETMPLADGEHSFHKLAQRWMHLAIRDPAAGWPQVTRFFDHLEANADVMWSVPQLLSAGGSHEASESSDDEDDDGSNPYGAAYEDVVYRDTTSDGVEGSTLEGGGARADFELDAESTRLGHRLAFLVTVARLWRSAAAGSHVTSSETREETLRDWFERSHQNCEKLEALVDVVAGNRLPEPIGTQESMVEYDRCRQVKEALLAKIILTCGETAGARRALLAAMEANPPPAPNNPGIAPSELSAATLCRALVRGDTAAARAIFPTLREQLDAMPVLYIPLARRGDPRRIVAAQMTQQLLLDLGRLLPSAGLVTEACQLVATAQAMERHRPAGEGAVTEFDRVFQRSYTALVEGLASSMPDTPGADQELIDVLQQLSETLLKRWVAHSRSLRLSVLERLDTKEKWSAFVAFIERYGHDIFTPRFLNLGNLRALLHQSVGVYLERLEDEGDCEWLLLDELDKQTPRAVAIESLTIAIEAVVENYGEFKDFNSTTTQSDRGELLYVLLDFLRLKANYERFAWTIRPVLLAHEVLVRRGKMGAAEQWRQLIAVRTSEAADWHLRRLESLVEQYGVRLPTVADRLQERFVRSLSTDRLRALVVRAIDESRNGSHSNAFELLEQEVAEFTENPTGAGLDVPDWLAALESEAFTHLESLDDGGKAIDDPCETPRKKLDWEELLAQVRTLEGNG